MRLKRLTESPNPGPAPAGQHSGLCQETVYERRLFIHIRIRLDAPAGLSSKAAAEKIYSAIQKADGKIVDEPDSGGLLQ